MKLTQITPAYGVMFTRRICNSSYPMYIALLFTLRHDMSKTHTERTIEGLRDNSEHLSRTHKEVASYNYIKLMVDT